MLVAPGEIFLHDIINVFSYEVSFFLNGYCISYVENRYWFILNPTYHKETIFPSWNIFLFLDWRNNAI